MRLKNLFLISSLFFLGCAHQLPDFTSRLSMRPPIESRPSAIGEYALGCLRGAQTFSGEEKGLVISQLKRGRYWGHPDLIQLLTKAGSEFARNKKKILIGDMSQSRGGPTLTGHNSHQNGLDVDVWFKVLSIDEKISFRDSELVDMAPIEELGPDQIKLINFFAEDQSVERIFINPSFKKKLCETSKLSAEVQHKLRAWWGHDDHIHVRLRCPIDSPTCVSQKPIPAGDGCGEDLNWWWSAEAKSGSDPSFEELKSVYLNKVKNLPSECAFYLETF